MVFSSAPVVFGGDAGCFMMPRPYVLRSASAAQSVGQFATSSFKAQTKLSAVDHVLTCVLHTQA